LLRILTLSSCHRVPRMASQLHGLSDIVKRLDAILEACGEKVVKDATPKDEFIRLKQRAYTLLEQARDDIHERHTLLKRRGNCYETIQKGHTIRQNIDELKRLLPKLQALLKKSQSSWRVNASQKDENQARYQDMRVLKKLVAEVDDLFQNTNAGDEITERINSFKNGPKASLFGLSDSARANPEDSKRLLTADEEDAIGTIRKRDAGIDKQLTEIGSVVERLNPLALQIGETAQQHKIQAEAIAEDVDQAERDIRDLNMKISDVMKYQKNTTCFCQLILGLTLLCCIGFVFQQLQM